MVKNNCSLISHPCRAKILQLIFEKLLLRHFCSISFDYFTNNETKVDAYSTVCKITIPLLVSEIQNF